MTTISNKQQHGAADGRCTAGGGDYRAIRRQTASSAVEDDDDHSWGREAARGARQPLLSKKGGLPPAAPCTPAVTPCLAYAVVSLATVFYNKWLFATHSLPVFTSFTQQVVTVLLYCWLVGVGRLCGGGGVDEGAAGLIRLNCPSAMPQAEVLLKFVPMTFSFAIMVAASNACLHLAPVSTYQVTRSLTVIFTAFLSYLLLGQTISWGVAIACGIIVCGYVALTADTASLYWLGVVVGGFSSVFQACYEVLVKRLLPAVDYNRGLMLYHNALLSSFILPLFALPAGEWHSLLRQPELYMSLKFWAATFGSGLLASALNFVTIWCVKATTPLTFNIVGISKAAIQATSGFVILGDPYTVYTVTGVSLKLIGSSLYTYFKYNELQASPSFPAARTTSRLPYTTTTTTAMKSSSSSSTTETSAARDIPAGMISSSLLHLASSAMPEATKMQLPAGGDKLNLHIATATAKPTSPSSLPWHSTKEATPGSTSASSSSLCSPAARIIEDDDLDLLGISEDASGDMNSPLSQRQYENHVVAQHDDDNSILDSRGVRRQREVQLTEAATQPLLSVLVGDDDDDDDDDDDQQDSKNNDDDEDDDDSWI